MPSSYTPSLRLELQADGENDSTWGDKANECFSLIEDSLSGIATVTMSDADYSLAVAYGAADEARKAILVVTGNLTTQRNIIVPAVSKTYVVRNVTSGGFAIQLKTQSGSGVVVKNGDTTLMYCDGANMIVVAGGNGSSGGVLPASLSTTVSSWTLYGSLGINRSEASQQGFGRVAVDGSVGAEYSVYFNGTLAGKAQAKLNSSGVLVGYDFNANGYPLSLSMSGAPALQVETDGTVDVAKTLTAAALQSTGSISANGNITGFSDNKLKSHWKKLDKQFVAKLAGVHNGTYRRRDLKGTRRFVGVSAQSLQEVMPEAVESVGGTLAVAYGNAALAAVIEVAKEVMALRAEVAALKRGK